MSTRRPASTRSLPLLGMLLGAVLACGDPRPQTITGTTSCAACHGFPPSTGAHAVHLALAAGPVGCFQCHKDVQALDDPDHVRRADGTLVPGPAEVRFDDPASLAGRGDKDPSYDPVTQTCSNVYCHGSFPRSKAAPPPAPTWSGGPATVACGTCHDLPPPPPTHVLVNVPLQGCGTSTDAALTCHPPAYTPTSVDPRLHVDGRICPPFCTPAP